VIGFIKGRRSGADAEENLGAQRQQEQACWQVM
jgi:hypothetical protein